MAFIKDNTVVLENGENIVFDYLYPIKIIWPFALMCDHLTVYNCIDRKYVVSPENLVIDDIFYVYVEGCDENENKIAILVTMNNSLRLLKFIGNSISSHDYAKMILSGSDNCDQNTIITQVIVLKNDNNIIIYVANNILYIKNNLHHTIIDKKCCHIRTDKVGCLLEIYLLKNSCIKMYGYDTNTNLVTLKQKIPIHININKNIRSHIIDHSGLLYCVNINNNEIVIKKIETEYRFCDISIANMEANRFLLLTFDNAVISYDGNNRFTVLDESSSFCLKKNQTKSARACV